MKIAAKIHFLDEFSLLELYLHKFIRFLRLARLKDFQILGWKFLYWNLERCYISSHPYAQGSDKPSCFDSLVKVSRFLARCEICECESMLYVSLFASVGIWLLSRDRACTVRAFLIFDPVKGSEQISHLIHSHFYYKIPSVIEQEFDKKYCQNKKVE